MLGAPGHTLTLQTEAPLAGSPARGHGVLVLAPATDERGASSTVGASINVGAVSQALAPAVRPASVTAALASETGGHKHKRAKTGKKGHARTKVKHGHPGTPTSGVLA
jgi:hypothetical protein